MMADTLYCTQCGSRIAPPEQPHFSPTLYAAEVALGLLLFSLILGVVLTVYP